MISFVNDYCECAHENILRRMAKVNYDKYPGYGLDEITESAKEKIKDACKCPQADIYFLVGGTQTNQIVIDTMLKPYEGVVACQSGHVNVHEAGAIEFTGHKVLTVPAHDGKIDAHELRQYAASFYADGNHEHMVFPGMVYISHPTEYGTLYTKSELEAIRAVCDEYHMSLYLDGARLAYALGVKESDVTMADIASLCDVFYIGGTKCGALMGEAVVFTKNNAPAHFVTQIKQHGALLAKGFLLGIQFDELFSNGLYKQLGRHAIEMATLIKAALVEKHYTFLLESPTNQILVVLENDQMEALSKKVNFSFWEAVDDHHTAIRFCTSWATKPEDVQSLIAAL